MSKCSASAAGSQLRAQGEANVEGVHRHPRVSVLTAASKAMGSGGSVEEEELGPVTLCSAFRIFGCGEVTSYKASLQTPDTNRYKSEVCWAPCDAQLRCCGHGRAETSRRAVRVAHWTKGDGS